MTTTGKNRIMIFGPKSDGTYVVEFRTAAGETLAISIPRTETAVIRHFQGRMPYGLFVPDVNGGRVVAYGKIVAERPLRGAAFVTGIVVLSAATLYQLKHHCEQYYTDAAA